MNEQVDYSDLLDPLEVAIGLEEKGKKIFADAAARVSGKHARRTFEFLVTEEDRHIERIRQFYDSIQKSGQDELPEVAESDASARLSDFNQRMADLREDIRPSSSDIEAYKFALRFENGAEEFYQEQMDKAKNQRVKQFYRWLIHEEEMHSKLLTSCLKFAEDPAAWFREQSQTSQDPS